MKRSPEIIRCWECVHWDFPDIDIPEGGRCDVWSIEKSVPGHGYFFDHVTLPDEFCSRGER